LKCILIFDTLLYFTAISNFEETEKLVKVKTDAATAADESDKNPDDENVQTGIIPPRQFFQFNKISLTFFYQFSKFCLSS